MINKIIILSREQIDYCINKGVFPNYCISNESLPEASSNNDKWALISIFSDHKLISNFEKEEKLKKLGCEEYVCLRFSDIEKQIENQILFNESHAKIIIDFIEKVKNQVETLVVHCAAGISRSGGVGLFACRFLNLNEEEFREKNYAIIPNIHIVNTLNKVSGINEDYLKFWRDLANKNTHNIKFVDN